LLYTFLVLAILLRSFVVFNLPLTYCFTGAKTARTLKNIDASMNSYDYLKSFHTWVKIAISNNSKVMRFFYPLIFSASLMPIIHALKSGEVTSTAISNSGFDLIYGIGL